MHKVKALEHIIILSLIRRLFKKGNNTTASDGSLVIVYEDNAPYWVDKTDVVVRK